MYYENQHMLNVALKTGCTTDQERAIKQAIQEYAIERLTDRGLRAVRVESKEADITARLSRLSTGTRWLDVHMTFMPEDFGYTVLDFIIAMTVMINEVFVTYEPKGFCWWGLTATTDELKAAVTT